MNSPSTNLHFSRIFKGDGLATALRRHEHYLFTQLALRPGMRVLEIGCGVGSLAFELARFADVSVVGIDRDGSKTKERYERARAQGYVSPWYGLILIGSDSPLSTLTSKTQATTADLRTVYADIGSFDAIFSVESLKTESDMDAICRDLHSFLRPGSKIAFYDWCWTPAVNIHNEEHIRLAVILEQLTGIGHRTISDRSTGKVIHSLQSSSFEDIFYEDLATRASNAMLPWYHFLDEAFRDPNTCWSSSTGGEGTFGGLTKPAAIVLAEAGRRQLFTPIALFIARRTVL